MRKVALLGLLLLGGCRPPDIELPEEAELRKNREKEVKSDDTRSVQSDGGSLKTYSKDRVLMWTVSWKAAALDFSAQESEFGGSLQSVAGQIFKEGKPAGSYKGQNAKVVKGSKVLTVTGGVQVDSVIPGSSISCDQMVYDADSGIIEAKGNITVHQGGYVFRGETHIMANEDQQIVGTPDLFEQEMKRGKSNQTKNSK